MIALGIAILALYLLGVRFGLDAILVSLAVASIGDAIRANKPKDWSLAQRVDALSEAYANGYKDARDEFDS